ncbi:MAG TPA: DUF3052 family protein [Polyangiaceae bacterium]|jgi:hypothetical protein|nr:DUF3052 family protein [Polyangiaceae bacterium]
MAPPSSAGYSGTPLNKKLGIKEGHTVALLAAPKSIADLLREQAKVANFQTDLRGRAPLNVIVLFASTRKIFESQLLKARKRLAQDGGLWVAWPKKASGVVTDMTENAVRDVALPTGLVDNKVCAIDQTWSGLRLVIRVANRK